MADVVAEEIGKVIEPVAVDQLKEAVKEPAKDEAVVEAVPEADKPESAEPEASNEESKEENGSEEAPKENGTSKDEKVAENGNTNGDAEDPERKRKSDVADETDGVVADGVSAEKKAKLEEKSEEAVAAPEASSNGESGVVA